MTTFYAVRTVTRVKDQTYHDKLSVNLVIPPVKRSLIVILQHVPTVVPMLSMPRLSPNVILQVFVVVLKTARHTREPKWLQRID